MWGSGPVIDDLIWRGCPIIDVEATLLAHRRFGVDSHALLRR